VLAGLQKTHIEPLTEPLLTHNLQPAHAESAIKTRWRPRVNAKWALMRTMLRPISPSGPSPQESRVNHAGTFTRGFRLFFSATGKTPFLIDFRKIIPLLSHLDMTFLKSEEQSFFQQNLCYTATNEMIRGLSRAKRSPNQILCCSGQGKWMLR
jgi:hypothetical protein